METIIKLHQTQYNAFTATKQFIAVVCGVQSGKTYLGAIWTQKKISEFPTKNGLIAAPTVKILQQATLEKFFQIFPEYRAYYKQQAGVIELPEGGKIFIRSTDEPLGLEGMTLHWAWLDESGMMGRLTWVVIRARVSTTGGQVLMTSTPHNLGWFYQEIFLPWKNGKDKDIEVFTWKSIDNPYFPVDYAEKERARMRPEEFARRYEGEFTKMEGLVWDVPTSQIFGFTPPLQQLLTFPDKVIGGIDWGYHNPAAIIVAKIKDARYYVIDEWKESEKTTADIINQARIFQRKHDVSIWYPDSAEPDRIEEFKRAGIRTGETSKDISVGLSLVGQLFREGKLFIHESCRMLLDEIEQYHFDEGVDGKPLKEFPVKVNDHLCDALRYMCMGYRPQDPRTIKQRELYLNTVRLKRQYAYD